MTRPSNTRVCVMVYISNKEPQAGQLPLSTIIMASKSLSAFGFTSSKRQREEDQDHDIPDEICAKRRKTPARESPSDDSENTSKKSKHGVMFFHGWLIKYKWLHYDEDSGMFCNLCLKWRPATRSKSVTWTDTGCTSYRHDILVKHSRSDAHMVAEGREREAKQSQVYGGIQANFDQQQTLERTEFVSALKCIYFLIKQEIAHTTNFGPILDLAMSMGCDYLKVLDKDKRTNYRSDTIKEEMVQVIGDILKEDLLAKLRKSPCFTILVDESTDISILSQMVIYAKYLVQGKPKVSFLSIKSLKNGTAETLTKTITEDINSMELDFTKLAGFGSDGASVMVGKRSGVATRLKIMAPAMISNHCVAHRLALSVKDAAASMPYIQKFNTMLLTVFYFYDNSPVRLAALKDIQTTMENPKLKPKKALPVRWLSHADSCETLRRILPSVLMSLHREGSERADAKAIGLVKFMESWRYVATLHMMCDLLPTLASLSKCFQASTLQYSRVKNQLDATIATLDARKIVPGEHFRDVSRILNDMKDGCFDGMECTEDELTHFRENTYNKFIDALKENLVARFPHSEILDAFTIFSPTNLPTEAMNVNDLEEYGHAELEDTLLPHFTEMDELSTMTEWKAFKAVLIRERAAGSNVDTVLQSLCTAMRDIYPNLAKLAEVGSVLPVHTADCERGFSTMKRIKTDQRNRLSNKTLEVLMMVSIQGPTVDEFPYELAADKWGRIRKRRLDI